MRIIPSCLIFLPIVLCLLLATNAFAKDENGFAATAVSACRPEVNGNRPRTVPSPDGHATVAPVSGTLGSSDWYIDVHGTRINISADAWPCPEFLWAPDSSALTVTYSDGGLVGGWHVGLYVLGSEEKSVMDIGAQAREDFQKHFPKCYSPSEPNMAAVAWFQGAKQLLVAAEVPPDSNCNDMGTFALYQVAVPEGSVIKKYGQREAKHLYGKLFGLELKNADDECFSKPGSCESADRKK